MTQLEFTEVNEHIYEIDKRQTRQEALKLLNRYRTFKLGAKDYDLKLTATYSIEPKNFSNEFNSNVENNVIRKIDYMLMIEDAVNRMSDADERRIIIEGYMSKGKHNWIKMSSLFLMSKSDYYRKRNKALISLASTLNKEVFKYK